MTVMFSSLTLKRSWPKRADSGGSVVRGPSERAPDIDTSVESLNFTVHTVRVEKVKRDKLCAYSGESFNINLNWCIMTVSDMKEEAYPASVSYVTGVVSGERGTARPVRVSTLAALAGVSFNALEIILMKEEGKPGLSEPCIGPGLDRSLKTRQTNPGFEGRTVVAAISFGSGSSGAGILYSNKFSLKM
ncbi:hypothetical protein P171DRAFT_506495 [Karstenula rhodostoma CBS 690.94]|uniref:Uncharacterized protein n=1 Tax=Karstenula rhodostoma CBS 690.94 TaxID=1392251 RepID=A0A9P4U4N8_9PLEO|nr:hypothetical protein P171DRAFT_506495 [Karstenula rhodostoma CBS 690.94]